MALETQWVCYGKNQEHIGYLAKLEKVDKDLPVVIVIQEIWGVDQHIQDVAERFAKAGYLAVAPDLYANDGSRVEDLQSERIEEVRGFLDSAPHSVWNNPDERAKALQELEDDKQFRINKTFEKMFGGLKSANYIEQLLATSAYLRDECEYSKGQGVASIGFCMGGALSGLLACRDPQLKGAAIFYGAAPSEGEIENIQCPVYGFYGDLDKRISDNVPHFAEQMQTKGKTFNYQIYPNTHHAFFNDNRSAYNVKSARDAFQRVLTFFNQVL